MPVFKLLIHVKPKANNALVTEIAGAYVSCFLNSESYEEAKVNAFQFLAQENWRPIDVEEYKTINEIDLADDSDALEVYYYQILLDGPRYTFHTYDKEDV